MNFLFKQTGSFDRKIIKFEEGGRGTVSFKVLNCNC